MNPVISPNIELSQASKATEQGAATATVNVVFLLSGDHFHSPMVLRELANQEDTKVLVITTPKFTKIKGGRKGVGSVLKESGFTYLASMALMKLWFNWKAAWERVCRVPLESRQYLSVPETIALCGCEHVHFQSVQDEECITKVKEFDPSLVFSVFFNQFVPNKIIDHVQSKANGGAYNIHPSPLPYYRGISPAFWGLSDSATKAGITIHELTPVIDQGEFVARDEFKIENNTTVFDLYRQCAELAAQAAHKILDCSRKGSKPPALPKPTSKGSYRSTITKEAVKKLKQNGHKFFRWF